jgi:enoyl-CoA hydratase
MFIIDRHIVSYFTISFTCLGGVWLVGVHETIMYEKRDGVAWITLNRPHVLNAQNNRMREELREVLEKAWFDDEVRVVVITGAGRAFSAGADLSEFAHLGSGDIRKSREKPSLTELIRSLPKPIVAAVNGYALGGGCELAMSCDIIIASENASFGQPEIRVGLIPGRGGTQLLPRLIGEKRAKELIFTGDIISASEAKQMGLINKVVPPEKLYEAVNDLVAKLSKKSQIILKLAKAAVNKSMELGLSEGLSYERELFSLCFSTEDQKEGAKAFLEKREPVFKGK